MANVNEIMEAMTKEGYTMEAIEVIKNGTELKGYTFKKEGYNIAPTLYDIEGKSIQELIDQVSDLYKTLPHNFNAKKYLSIEHFKQNATACLQKPGHEDIIKKDFLDMEEYIRLVVEGNREGMGSIKIKAEHLEAIGLSIEEAFKYAEENAKADAESEGILEVMAKIGMDIDALPLDAPQMIILSNKNRVNGASAMLNTDKIKAICKQYHAKGCYILPSSIHECIIHTDADIDNKTIYDEMVNDVNTTVVTDAEVLSNHSYYFDADTMKFAY